MQGNQYYSLWSFPECLIAYFFACPTCRRIWDYIPLIHNYIDGPPKLKIPYRCPGCKKEGYAFVESKTGMVEEIRMAMAANEFDSNKNILNRKGDLPGLFRLNLRHSYLDMRVIAWETGGPAPIGENPPSGWPSEDEFVHQFDHIFKVIDSWWEDEPFMSEILNERINKRMTNLRNASVDIPKDDFTAMPYENFLDDLLKNRQAKPQEELTSEIMLSRINPPMPLDLLRGTLASIQWPLIFSSEARILFIEENRLFEKENHNVSLFLTIAKARNGDLTALQKLIAWDYVWITCPWVGELIRTQPYDFDIHEMLKDAFSSRPGYFKRKQRPGEQVYEQEKLMQFLYDRFGAELKDTDKFFEKTFNDKYDDGSKDYENLKKFRKKHLRK